MPGCDCPGKTAKRIEAVKTRKRDSIAVFYTAFGFHLEASTVGQPETAHLVKFTMSVFHSSCRHDRKRLDLLRVTLEGVVPQVKKMPYGSVMLWAEYHPIVRRKFEFEIAFL